MNFKLKAGLAATALSLLLAGCVSNNSETTAKTDYLQRSVQDDVFYFVLPDRFHNGDPSNDNGSKTLKISQGGFDKTHRGRYHGGDVRGLMEKLDYIEGMGVTAIWLTPILRNQALQNGIAGYHGYWVLDFTEIDPHLGSNADLKAFIDAAHERGMKVYFDIITNHTADVIKFKECHGEDGQGWSATDNKCPYKSLAQIAAGDTYSVVVPKGMENVKSPAWLNDPKYYHNQGDTSFEGENSLYGDFFGLDDVDTDNPEVVQGMVEIFNNIITEFKPDGFRVDTVKHVNMEFWQGFAPPVIAHAQSIGIPNFFVFGEVYSGDADVLSSFTTTGKLPSVLDFGFQGAVWNAIVANNGAQHLEKLFANDYKYKDKDSDANQLLNFVGNHDMGRIGFHLNNPEFGYSMEEKLARTKLAHALMYFARGIPVVYYGDEQGFVGDGGDHDARQDMMPSQVASFNDDVLMGTDKTTADDNFDTSHVLYKTFKQYADIYKAHYGLRHGEQLTMHVDQGPGIFGFTRNAGDGEKYLVLFNTANEAKTYRFPDNLATFKAVHEGQGAKQDDREFTVPALDFVIYQMD